MSGEQLGSPAAAILARRDSGPVMPERLKEPAPDDSSDEDWDLDEDEGEEGVYDNKLAMPRRLPIATKPRRPL